MASSGLPSSAFSENYETAGPVLRKLYDSKLRLAILDALKDGPLRLAELRRKVNANAPNTSSKAKDLEDLSLVERSGGQYRLTPYGKATRKMLKKSLRFHATYEKFREFWNARKTEDIPSDLWLRLGDLAESEIKKGTKVSPTTVYRYCVERFKSIKDRFFVLSAIHELDFRHIFMEKIDRGADVRLITTPEVLDFLVEMAKKDELFKEHAMRLAKKEGGFLIYEDSLTAFLSLADDLIILDLESKEPPGHYLSACLASSDAQAVQWGLELFDHYAAGSKPVSPSLFS